MGPTVRKLCSSLILAVFSATSGFASPLSSRLLPLVPPGAGIVAGFENHPGPTARGRLMLTTRNNRLDLDDFQAVTGVDNKRVFDEVIEVAAAPHGGPLSEHMVLVAGQMDRERIFRSLEENRAQPAEFRGERILIIKPFARERIDMLDTRWLAILDNRIAILGTPWLVQKAIRRYTDHAVPDSVLEERLTLLRPDVTSWNILVGAQESAHTISFAQPHSAWAELQQGADVLMVAARFGTKIRVDFSIHADSAHGAEFFARKANVFSDALADATSVSKPAEPAGRPLQNFVLEPNRVQGSVELSGKDFAAWCDHLYMVRAGIAPSATAGN